MDISTLRLTKFAAALSLSVFFCFNTALKAQEVQSSPSDQSINSFSCQLALSGNITPRALSQYIIDSVISPFDTDIASWIFPKDSLRAAAEDLERSRASVIEALELISNELSQYPPPHLQHLQSIINQKVQNLKAGDPGVERALNDMLERIGDRSATDQFELNNIFSEIGPLREARAMVRGHVYELAYSLLFAGPNSRFEVDVKDLLSPTAMNNIKLTEKKYFSDRILRRNLDVVRVTDAGIHQWIEIKSYYMPLHIEHDEFHRTFKKVVDVSKAAYFEEIYTGEKIEVVLAFTRAAPTPEAIRKFKDRGIKILILK